MAHVTPEETCVLPNPYYPWVTYTVPGPRLPTPWDRGSFHANPCCYFVEGLHPLPDGNWGYFANTYFERWELNGGMYYRFGFLEPMTYPITPPGDFVIEVVSIYYYAGKSTGQGLIPKGEASDVSDPRPK
jgi:hypothetical protein